MKWNLKDLLIIFSSIILVCILSLCLSSSYRKSNEPSILYEVYLDGKIIGVVRSKNELDNYIDMQNQKYKDEYHVDRVYSPNGLETEKVLTYDKTVNTVEEVYEKI